MSSVTENPEVVSDNVGQSDAVDAVELAEVVEEGIAAAYEQAAGAPVEAALETVLDEEQARGVELNEEFARPFAEAISRGEDPLSN
ncbi:hypothetical protein [Cryptosporangium arvum]|uniref:Uncharacterized protein n=1 Tax=Cryptosporangium arvum DSM 44712 TaxID=927661 RepID=A0A010ZQP2_9ACTN|nr:hypothetical protein [Cryptosporangium arvum]EXG80994.1 hypothetical protein CryarDRAFT_2089 [Cryptosporangium arvum DSM 44712]